MSKKTTCKKVINNIDKLNLDIDYDKLAEAIVKANAKQQELYSPSREWMKYILTPIFWCVSVLSAIIAIVLFVSVCKNINAVFESGTIIEIAIVFLKFILTLFLISFCVFTIATAKEIDKEKDRTYIASMFSNIIAIVALVVSLVALLKGVR